MNEVVKKTSITQGCWNKAPNAIWSMFLSVPTTFCFVLLSILLLPEKFLPNNTSKGYFAFFLFVSFFFIWEITLAYLKRNNTSRLSWSVKVFFFLLWAGITTYFQLWNSHVNAFPLFSILVFMLFSVSFILTKAFFSSGTGQTGNTPSSIPFVEFPPVTSSPSPITDWEKSAAHDENSFSEVYAHGAINPSKNLDIIAPPKN